MKRIPSHRNLKALHSQGFLLPENVSLEANGYEGASTSGRLVGYRPTGAGPNVLIGSSHTEIRNRARQQVRDNPRAVTAVDTYTRNVIGCGIRPNWQVKDKGLKKEIGELWGESHPELDADGKNDFYGLQALVCNCMFESGETFVRMRTRRLSDGLAVPLQLQVLEPDHLNDAVTRYGANRVEMGVEINPVGQRVAYHMFRGHPNDRPTADMSTTRVPADEVAHVYKVRRPGQLRGISWLAPTLVRLYELDKGEDALQVLMQVASMLTGFIRRDSGDETIADIFGDKINSLVEGRAAVYEDMHGLTAGDLRVLAPGDNIEFPSLPDIGSNYQPWLKSSIRTFAAALGLTYESISGDLEDVNFSSIRAGLIEVRRGFEATQKQIIVHQLCRPVARWWMDSAVASGQLDIPDYADNPRPYLKIDWVPDAFDYVQPEEDVKADILEIQAGLAARQDKIRARSDQADDVDERRKEDQDREKQNGLQPPPPVSGATPTGNKPPASNSSNGQQSPRNVGRSAQSNGV